MFSFLKMRARCEVAPCTTWQVLQWQQMLDSGSALHLNWTAWQWHEPLNLPSNESGSLLSVSGQVCSHAVSTGRPVEGPDTDSAEEESVRLTRHHVRKLVIGVVLVGLLVCAAHGCRFVRRFLVVRLRLLRSRRR